MVRHRRSTPPRRWWRWWDRSRIGRVALVHFNKADCPCMNPELRGLGLDPRSGQERCSQEQYITSPPHTCNPNAWNSIAMCTRHNRQEAPAHTHQALSILGGAACRGRGEAPTCQHMLKVFSHAKPDTHGQRGVWGYTAMLKRLLGVHSNAAMVRIWCEQPYFY